METAKKDEIKVASEMCGGKFEEKFNAGKDCISGEESSLNDLIERIEKVKISDNIKIREKRIESRNGERRRTKLLDGADIVGDSEATKNANGEEEELDSVESLLMDERFFSNVPISDSEGKSENSVDPEEDDYVEPPYELYPGWCWNSKKKEFCLRSNSGRIRRKMYVSPKVYGNLRDHPHQYDGVRWMWSRFRRSEGGILADEMGLGKTIQVCVFIGALYRSEIASFMLVILPASLMSQWVEELDKWCPKIPKFTYHGASNARDCALKGLYSSERGGILITTFETFRNDVHKLSGVDLRMTRCLHVRNPQGIKVTPKDYLMEISQSKDPERSHNIPWDIVIVDEAHKLKNCKTKIFKDTQTLKSYCKILCTGTPFQNRLAELWSLIQCVKPNLLGKNIKAFNHNYARHITNLNNEKILDREKKSSEKSINQLKHMIRPFILRRTKQMVSQARNSEVSTASQETPDSISTIGKYDIVLWHSLSKDQSESYTEILDSHMVSSIIHSCSVSQSKQKSGAVLEAIICLLKVCKHPLLLLRPEFQTWRALLEEKDPVPTDGRQRDEEDEVVEVEAGVEEELNPDLTDPPRREAVYKPPGQELMFSFASRLPQLNIELLREQSAKLKILNILIPRILESRDNKVLLFSESLFMLDLVELTVLAPNNIGWERLEGKQSLDERSSSIDSFNTDKEKRVLLLSKHIGATGLNLTTANRVILLEPHWNPTQDEQAIGRAYRIGQKRDVIVYRLIAAGTLEDCKFRLQLHKSGLANSFLKGAKQGVTFTHEELKHLFSHYDVDSSDIHEVVFKCSVNDKHYEILKDDIGKDCIRDLEPFVMAYLDFENIQKIE
ncbi:hypothetical protein OIY81_2207 [Cryptosporidium canis]|nr:hypothetical protein OIY81_2207 [Cryptosporidium canis]